VVTHAVAVRFQLLPDVIDFSYVLALSGFGGLLATLVAASLRFGADRWYEHRRPAAASAESRALP
jgi:hypothetical protein